MDFLGKYAPTGAAIIVPICFVGHWLLVRKARRRKATDYPGVSLWSFSDWQQADIRAKLVFFVVVWTPVVVGVLLAAIGAAFMGVNPLLMASIFGLMSGFLKLYMFIFLPLLLWAAWLGDKAAKLRNAARIEQAVANMRQQRSNGRTPSVRQHPQAVPHTSTAQAVRDAKQALHNGKPSEAITRLESFRGAVEDTEVLTILGIAYAQNGQLELAKNALRQAIRTQPGFGAIHYNLAMVLYRAGEYPAAWDEIGACRTCNYNVPEQFRQQLTLAMPEPK